MAASALCLACNDLQTSIKSRHCELLLEHMALAQVAALRMAFSEYGDLSPAERAAVLSTLATLALGNETIRNHFYEQAEASIGPVRTAPKVSQGAGFLSFS